MKKSIFGLGLCFATIGIALLAGAETKKEQKQAVFKPLEGLSECPLCTQENCPLKIAQRCYNLLEEPPYHTVTQSNKKVIWSQLCNQAGEGRSCLDAAGEICPHNQCQTTERAQAAPFFEKACKDNSGLLSEQGHFYACLYTAQNYRDGVHVQKSLQKALSLLRDIGSPGSTSSVLSEEIGFFYIEAEDEAAALPYLIKACEKGSSQMCFFRNLSILAPELFNKGSKPKRKESETSIPLLSPQEAYLSSLKLAQEELVVEQGFCNAYASAVYLARGEGVSANETLAKEGFAQALETAHKRGVYTPKWIHRTISVPSCHIVFPKNQSTKKASFTFTPECQNDILRACKAQRGQVHVK